MSCIRQEHELGNDIATAIEDGEEKDFTAHMPMMQTAEEPRRPSKKASEARVAEHELKHAQHEVQKKSHEPIHKVEVAEFVKRKQTYEHKKEMSLVNTDH